jgi:hypothetical protein
MSDTTDIFPRYRAPHSSSTFTERLFMSPYSARKDVPDLVHEILESCGLSLFQTSRQSRERYPDPTYHIPHQFYSDLRHPGFTPNLQQMLALSSLTDYRLSDWMAVFGFRLDAIPTMQAILPALRTHLIDATVYDDQQAVPWFSDVPSPPPAVGVLPLGRFLSGGLWRSAGSFLPAGRSPFLYAKVGSTDDFAFPELLPGSIVRVDTRRNLAPLSSVKNSRQAILLIEHARGFCFCRSYEIQNGRILMRSTQIHYPPIELDREARILGVADLELRCLLHSHDPQVPGDFRSYAALPPLTPRTIAFGALLASARARAGLSYRAASAISYRIRQDLGDPRYFCAPGALSDYETRSGPPRHLHKLITLSIAYSLEFTRLLGAAGLDRASAGHRPIPGSLLPRLPASAQSAETSPSKLGFLSDLLKDIEEVPIFLREALPTLAGLPNLSLRDLYWIGGKSESSHLKNTLLAAVKRRSRKPSSLPGKDLCSQPVYLLMTRSSGYLAAPCRLEGEVLVAYPFIEELESARRFRNGIDAEVVGRLVALVRWLR